MGFLRRRGDHDMVTVDPTDGPATREQVVAAARSLYGGQGFARVTSADVASLADTTAVQVDAMFPDPADLFAEVYHQVLDETGRRVAESLSSDDPIEAMRAGIRTWVGANSERAARRILVLDGPQALGWTRWRQEGDHYGRMLIDTLLADAMAQGRIAEQPVKPLAYLLVGALETGVQYASREPDVPAALDQVRAALESMIDAFAALGPGVSPR